MKKDCFIEVGNFTALVFVTRGRYTERDTERQKETERDRERQRETERDRERQRETGRQTECVYM
jgi:hypothetical protein